MNKISLAGLIFGIVVVGILFFAIGFLAAITTFGTGGSTASTTSWASANSSDPKNGAAGGELGKFAGAVGGRLLHNQVAHLQAKFGGGALSKVVNNIPPSLQPFVLQAQNHLAIKSQQRISGIVSGGVGGVFAPRAFGAAQNKPQQLPPSNYQPQSNAVALPQQQRRGVFYPKKQQFQQAGQPQYRPYPGQPALQYQMVQPQPQPQYQP